MSGTAPGTPFHLHEVLDRATVLGVAPLVSAPGVVEHSSLILPSELARRSGSGVVAGFALTAWNPRGNNTMTWAVLAHATDSSVIVLASPDDSVAQWGALVTELAEARGVRGVVVGGAVRDLSQVSSSGVSVWSRSVNPSEPAKDVPGTLGRSLPLGDVVFRTGDLVVADDDGVLVVPRHAVPAALEHGERRVEQERELMSTIAREGLAANVRTRLGGVLPEALLPSSSDKPLHVSPRRAE